MPVSFDVTVKLAQLYRLIIYFEGRVLRPSTDARFSTRNFEHILSQTLLTKSSDEFGRHSMYIGFNVQ
jgi:hypothetical protein